MSQTVIGRCSVVVAFAALISACNQPIEIAGEGDVLSATGDRDCLLVDYEAQQPNCTENIITGAYQETYYGVPHTGWHFHRWANYCTDALTNECSFDVPEPVVTGAAGATVDPLIAIFRPDINTGFNSLFIGHSFFEPFAAGMPSHAAQTGFSTHSQNIVFGGAGSGAPQALWENAGKRLQIQGILDEGEVDLFGMTYHYDYPSLEGYRNWVGYALEKNPDTRFFIGLPWLPSPGISDAASYAADWAELHVSVSHSIVDSLREEFPGVDFYCIPYGQAAVELRNLFAAGNLPDVESFVSASGDALFRDSFGHADDILEDLGRLIWLRAIYGVDLQTYAYDPGYQTDLKAIAQAIMDAHDPVYNAP